MVAFYTALISSIFVSNSILSGFKGMCSYLGISKNRTAAFGMGCALTFVCVISGLICWGLGFLLRALDIYFMFTIVAILVIASLVQFVELVIKKFVPSLYKRGWSLIRRWRTGGHVRGGTGYCTMSRPEWDISMVSRFPPGRGSI